MSLQRRILEVPAGSDSSTTIPITTIRGSRPGPVLALTAGIHGYEYPPILALQRLPALIDPETLAGVVVMVHVANMPSFLGRTIYFSPVDGRNLNRVFPGKPDGTVSERIAHAITTEIIDKADYLIDLHCGDGNESLRPYLYQTITGDSAIDDKIAGLALSFGLDHIIVDRGRPHDPANSMYCSNTAITRGKPAMTIESGFLGSTDAQSTQQIIDGVLSAMRHLKMLEGTPLRVQPVYLEPSEVLTSPETGILYPHVEQDQKVTGGDTLAHITDFFGNQVAEIQAPFDGVVLYIVATPPITKGQPVAMVGAPRK